MRVAEALQGWDSCSWTWEHRRLNSRHAIAAPYLPCSKPRPVCVRTSLANWNWGECRVLQHVAPAFPGFHSAYRTVTRRASSRRGLRGADMSMLRFL